MSKLDKPYKLAKPFLPAKLANRGKEERKNSVEGIPDYWGRNGLFRSMAVSYYRSNAIRNRYLTEEN